MYKTLAILICSTLLFFAAVSPGADGARVLSPHELRAFVKIVRENPSFATHKKVTCNVDATPCTQTIAVLPLYDNNNAPGSSPSACAIQVDEIDINPTSDETKITWTLDLSKASANASFKFDTSGYVILDYTGKPLSDPKLSNDLLVLTAKHHYTKKGDSLDYYPLVYMTVGGKTSLCASYDPTIVNN